LSGDWVSLSFVFGVGDLRGVECRSGYESKIGVARTFAKTPDEPIVRFLALRLSRRCIR